MADFGEVAIDENNNIINFTPKGKIGSLLINTGTYIINKSFYLNNTPDKAFSIEDEFFNKMVRNKKFVGVEMNGYFIDIGIPNDYEKAIRELNNNI